MIKTHQFKTLQEAIEAFDVIRLTGNKVTLLVNKKTLIVEEKEDQKQGKLIK